MAAIHPADPGKTQMQIAALQIPVNHLAHIGPPEAVHARITLIPGHLQLFEVRLDASIILAGLGVALLVQLEIAVLCRCVQHIHRPFSKSTMMAGDEACQLKFRTAFPTADFKGDNGPGSYRRLLSDLRELPSYEKRDM
jgi:hypothetical protein